ncbi:MAG: molecular chaperone DnaJ [Candidatus Falkowbacteria bacterium]
MSKDYYNILGVAKDASAEEIKTAFRKKAHQHHPDKGGDAEKFKELNEAYQVLGHADKRQQYDQFGSAFQNGQAGGRGGYNPGNMGGFDFSGFSGGGVDMDDLFGGFGDIFGFGGGRNTSKRAKQGNDLEMVVNLEFKEAAFGLEKELTFSKNIVCHHCQGIGAEPGTKIETCATCGGSGQVIGVQRTILGNIQTRMTCSTCHGEGKIYNTKCSKCHGVGLNRESVKLKVKIPAGINDGESIRLSGQGEAGEKGAASGDLYLRVRVAKHPLFVRNNYDINTEESISVKQAILGDKIEVETIYGPVNLKIPEGTQSGTTFKLKEKGVTKLNNRGVGDQYVKINVKIPKDLSKKERGLLESLDI